MVMIPINGDPTLDAMRRASVENAKKEKTRDYLGASVIGHPCARKIWYGVNGYACAPFDVQTLYRFEDGHRTEDLIIQRLRAVHGVEVWNIDEDGNQYGFSDFGGKFKGHVDGIILGLLQAPKTPHVLEIKCTEKLSEFQKAKADKGEKGALKKWSEQYYIQAQIYMHYFKLTRHYTIVASPGGRSFDSCRTEYAPEVAQQYKDRAFEIIKAKEPPVKISEKPDFYLCNWCEFKNVCHA